MIDLPLMSRLVAAVPASAQLVLLGDRDQLASVEAGSVLGDLCNRGNVGDSERPMARCIAVLTKSHRFSADSGIGAVARAANAGDANGAFAALASHADIAQQEVASTTIAAAVGTEVERHLAAYRHQHEPAAAIRAFNRFRFLCALRDGPFGVDNINRLAELSLAQRGLIDARQRHYDGRPLLVTRNDYGVQLFNGDTGLVLRDGDGVLRARVGIVFQRPLPYLYLARRAFEGARVPYLASDALPLAAEPYAAAVDLLLEYVWSNASRAATAALLRSPAFRFEDEAGRIGPADVTEFEQHVLSLRVPGEPGSYRAIASAPPAANPRQAKRQLRAARVAAAAGACWDSLRVLADESAPVGARVESLIAFLQRHEAPPPAGPEARERHLRARAAIVSAIRAIGAAADTHALILTTEELTATIRRWIEEQTFAPRRGAGGVELVDATAARYGQFDHLRVLGLVESDWPVRPPRNVFYGRFLLGTLGWPDDQKRLALAYAAFKDLICLPASTLALSSFHLDDDAIVGPSAYLDAVNEAGLTRDIDRSQADAAVMHFPWEALVARPALTDALDGEAAAWAERRVARGDLSGDRYRGQTGAFEPGAYSVSALETYLRCPFRYFASKVLKLPEERDDEPGMTPQERGHFLHEVVHRFYASWDASPGGPVTPDTLDEALVRFREIAEAALAALPPADRAQERTLLLGSAASPGLGERLLHFEMQLPGRAARRILEQRAEGTFDFAGPDGPRRITLNAVADRIDVLEGDGLRVIDYKLNALPDKEIALQLPVYGVCQSKTLSEEGGGARTLTAAAYFSFNHRKEPRVYAGEAVDALLSDGQARLVKAVEAIERGEFPARPNEARDCKWCPYPSVCRKEYAGDE